MKIELPDLPQGYTVIIKPNASGEIKPVDKADPYKAPNGLKPNDTVIYTDAQGNTRAGAITAVGGMRHGAPTVSVKFSGKRRISANINPSNLKRI